jgi:hypothetical protein
MMDQRRPAIKTLLMKSFLVIVAHLSRSTSSLDRVIVFARLEVNSEENGSGNQAKDEKDDEGEDASKSPFVHYLSSFSMIP